MTHPPGLFQRRVLPWTQILGPAPIALAVIHVAYPLIAASRTTPLLVAAVDAAALYAAYRFDVWGELTIVVVPLLGAIAFIALAYAAIVVSLPRDTPYLGPLGRSEVCLRSFAQKLRRLIPEARLEAPPPPGWSGLPGA